MNLARLLLAAAERAPGRTALEWEGGACTYGELARRVALRAEEFEARGVRPGQRIALWYPSDARAVVDHLATLRVGAIAVPIGERWSVDEVTHALRLSTPSLGVAAEGWADRLVPEARRPFEAEQALPGPIPAGGEVAQILFSSGTTGRPKGVALSAGNVAHVVGAKLEAFGLSPADRIPLLVPLAHCYGLNAILGPGLAAGATLIVRNGLPTGGGAAWLREVGATVLCAVPGTYQRILDEGEVELPALRIAFSAAAPLPQDVAERWLAATGRPIQQGYGLTESAPFATWEEDPAHFPGSVGRPIPGVEVRVVDDEVQLRGPNVMLGYWDDPAATNAAIDGGWLRTGDSGHLAPDGRLYLTGRLKEMINVNGLKAWPAEVERVLTEHPSVREAAAFGVADAASGERVEAAVVAHGDAAGLAEELIRRSRELLAPHKVPRRVHVVTMLPRSATGKLRRHDLAERLVPRPSTT